MIVVADTSPINYLVLIDKIDILATLYQRVLIPGEVHRELQAPGTPPSVRVWAEALPDWCQSVELTIAIGSISGDLDAGESEAILLAQQRGIDSLLMDDSLGRMEARRLKLRVTGTLGVLEFASQQGLLNFRETLVRLEQTNFRVSDAIRKDFLSRNP